MPLAWACNGASTAPSGLFPGSGLVSSGSSQRCPLACPVPGPAAAAPCPGAAGCRQGVLAGSGAPICQLVHAAASPCAVSKGCFASVAQMGKAKVKKHPPPSDTAANTLSCKPPCNGPCCVDLTSPVDWVSACQAGHWISRKPMDEAGSFAASLWPGVSRRCAGDKDRTHQPPCDVPGRDQKPLTRWSCCCQGEKEVRHPHPEPQAAKRVTARCRQHPALGTCRPCAPAGSSPGKGGQLRAVGALSLATLCRAPAGRMRSAGQERDASPTPALCYISENIFLPSTVSLCSVELDRPWDGAGHGLPMGDGVWSQPDVKGSNRGSSRGSGLHTVWETSWALAKQR